MGEIKRTYGLDERLETILNSQRDRIKSVQLLLHLSYHFNYEEAEYTAPGGLSKRIGLNEKILANKIDYTNPFLQHAVLFYQFINQDGEENHKVHIGRFPVEKDCNGNIQYRDRWNWDKVLKGHPLAMEFKDKWIDHCMKTEEKYRRRDYFEEHKQEYIISFDAKQEIQDQIANHLLFLGKSRIKDVTLYLPVQGATMEKARWHKNDREIKTVPDLLKDNAYESRDVKKFLKACKRKEKKFCELAA